LPLDDITRVVPIESKVRPSSDSQRLPLFLSFNQRRVVVVGGGNVAAAKLPTLLSAGAVVTLIAPKVVPSALVPGVTVHRRHFRGDDLDGAWFVVAAATPSVNARVARAAARRRLFVNAVDNPENASAFFAGIVRRGDFTLALSSGGRSPALVRLLREAIEDLLPKELDTWLNMARVERQQWLRNQTPINNRVPILAAAIGRLYPIE
jgi:uroporphyrin-III C-methyltransferase/precorrin-2 dehydrogenase/sirohydrochlorin ferrochelatase